MSSLFLCTGSSTILFLPRLGSILPKTSQIDNFNGQVDRALATETVDKGSIAGRFKPWTIKIGIHSHSA